MTAIVKGTTPTIYYTFSTVSVQNISVAYLTIKQFGEIVVEKDISSASIRESALAWTLTQEETLLLDVGSAKIMLNWLLSDGTRGIGKETEVKIKNNHKDEVI